MPYSNRTTVNTTLLYLKLDCELKTKILQVHPFNPRQPKIVLQHNCARIIDNLKNASDNSSKEKGTDVAKILQSI